MTRLPIAILVASLAVAGCAEVPDSTGVQPVVDASKARLGAAPVWRRGGAEDAAVEARIDALLSKPLSPEGVIEVGLLNSPDIQAAFEDIGIAQGELVQAGLLDNPGLEVSLLAASPQTLYAGTITQNFLSVFTVAARRHFAGEALDRTSYLVASQLVDYAASVRAAYYRLVADRQAAGLNAQVTDATSAAAELAERQRRAGTLNARDQLLHQQLYATTILAQAKAEADLANDREALNRFLGLWGKRAVWSVPDRLPDPPADAVPAAPILEATAIAGRLDLAAARKDVESAADRLGFEQDYRFLQGFGLGFTYERDSDNAHDKGPVLQFTLPIFDQGQGKARVLEATLRQRERLMAKLAIDLRSSVRAAALQLAASEAVLRHYRAVLLPLSEQLVAEQQRFYNGMLVGVYDLLQAKRGQIETGRDYIAALKDYWLTRTELERLVGGPLHGQIASQSNNVGGTAP